MNFVEKKNIEPAKVESSFHNSSVVFQSKDKPIDEAMKLSNTEIVDELSLPPVKIHCSVLAEDAIKAAIADYKSKNDGVEHGESNAID